MFAIIFACALIAVFVLTTKSYNKLVSLKLIVSNCWSQIDVQMQRRFELIPNLVKIAKSAMDFESTTLHNVISARNNALNAFQNASSNLTPESIQKAISADNALTSSMRNFFAVAENYPTLKSLDNVKSLQEELASTENRIAFARQAYNDAAMEYNTQQKKFPINLVASKFGHEPVDFYTANTKAKENLDINI